MASAGRRSTRAAGSPAAVAGTPAAAAAGGGRTGGGGGRRRRSARRGVSFAGTREVQYEIGSPVALHLAGFMPPHQPRTVRLFILLGSTGRPTKESGSRASCTVLTRGCCASVQTTHVKQELKARELEIPSSPSAQINLLEREHKRELLEILQRNGIAMVRV